jgi:hypothetical protein
MTPRELWQNIMWYKGHDRMPVIHWGGWPETHERWVKEGMPEDINEREYFGAVPHWTFVGISNKLYPPFEEIIFEETDEYKIYRGTDGVIQKEWKHQSNIPHYIDFTLKTANDWDEYKKRLQPDIRRIPANLKERIEKAESSNLPIAIDNVSLMGWIRDWMGVENLAYFMYDEPDVFADMIDTISDLACWTIDQVLPVMKTKPDMGFGWEDICGKSGPFVSPSIFRKYVAPGYTKIRNKLEEYGVHLLGIDSDGDLSALLGPWLDAGVNVVFPLEIGTWNADSMEVRKKYGRELRVIGGFNKLALEKNPVEIDKEIQRRIPIMKEGGFILMPDHLITPGTSLSNYKYYLEQIRRLRL